jgi:hypothetical protein
VGNIWRLLVRFEAGLTTNEPAIGFQPSVGCYAVSELLCGVSSAACWYMVCYAISKYFPLVVQEKSATCTYLIRK